MEQGIKHSYLEDTIGNTIDVTSYGDDTTVTFTDDPPLSPLPCRCWSCRLSDKVEVAWKGIKHWCVQFGIVMGIVTVALLAILGLLTIIGYFI